MPTSLEYAVARRWPGTQRGSRSRGTPLKARVSRAMNHALVRCGACSAWLTALALIVFRAIGYPLEL